MTHREKKMKAIFAAIALYLEQEATQEEPVTMTSNWSDMGKTMIMSNRTMVQRKGRMLRNRA